MKLTPWVAALSVSALSLIASTPSLAQPGKNDLKPGLSGAVGINLGLVDGTSQFNTSDDNAITSDLNNNGKSYTSAAPMLLGRLQYSFGDTAIFVGNSRDQIAEAQFQAEVGVIRRLYADNTITVAFFGNVPSMDETWQDPYLIGSERETSDQTIMGGRVALDFGLPIPVSMSYAIANSEVENDEIGISLPLSNDERSLLKRDSVYQRATLDLSIPISANLRLTPGVQYTLRDADGEAQSHQHRAIQLAVSGSIQRHSLTATLRISETEYDAINPVFNKKRDSDNLGLFAVYNYMGLFSWPGSMFNVMAGYSESDSDITFYDSENLFISAGVGFRF